MSLQQLISTDCKRRGRTSNLFDRGNCWNRCKWKKITWQRRQEKKEVRMIVWKIQVDE
jgi:hypothetical protein